MEETSFRKRNQLAQMKEQIINRPNNIDGV
jgi:hypothetical protein